MSSKFSEKSETEVLIADRLWRVSLRQKFKTPEKGGKPIEGSIYRRGGKVFTTTDGEGQSWHIVTTPELEKFKMARNQQFATDPLIKEIDPTLYVCDAKTGEEYSSVIEKQEVK